jgi:hypothetical protein
MSEANDIVTIDTVGDIVRPWRYRIDSRIPQGGFDRVAAL